MTPRNPPLPTDVDVDGPNGPTRTCIGCRGKGSRTVLMRLVVIDGNVEIDERRSKPGRGAYVHPNPECLTRAVERKAVGRALRAPDAATSGLARVSVGTPPTIESDRTGDNPDEDPMSIST